MTFPLRMKKTIMTMMNINRFKKQVLLHRGAWPARLAKVVL
jgi:hypothetical protein